MHHQPLDLTQAVRLDVPQEVAAAAAARSQHIPGPEGIAAAWRSLPVHVQDRIGTLAVSVAFNSWLWADETQEPAERWLTDDATQAAGAQSDRDYEALMRAIEGAVPELVGTAGQDPAWSSGAELPAPSPIRSAIALHRATWAALQARAGFLQAAAWSDRADVQWPEDDAEAAAFGDLFLVSCRDSAEARLLVDHLAWAEAVRTQHPRGTPLSARVATVVSVRRADLALILGAPVSGVACEPCVAREPCAAEGQPGGDLAARLEAQRNGTVRRAGRRVLAGHRYPITYEGLGTHFRRTLDKAGIANFRIHDLRHTAATRALRATGNLRFVQQLLAHSSPTTTAKYAHTDLNDMRRLMAITAADDAERRSRLDGGAVNREGSHVAE